MDDNFDPAHPLYREIAELAAAHAATTRRCATAPSSTATRPAAPGIYAFSRIDRREQREYVVALNNSEQRAVGVDPDVRRERGSRRSTATAPARLRERRATGG